LPRAAWDVRAVVEVAADSAARAANPGRTARDGADRPPARHPQGVPGILALDGVGFELLPGEIHALDGVGFELLPGEIHALAGA